MIDLKKFQSKSHVRTRDFVASFTAALRNPDTSDGAVSAMADDFRRQVQKKYTTVPELLEKHRRVSSKLFASYPGLDRTRLQTHAPEYARFAPPTPREASEAEAATLLSDTRAQAASLVGDAKTEAATLVRAATKQAKDTIQAAQGQAAKTKEDSEALLREAHITRESAKQSATGMLAHAQRESAKATRESREKISLLEAETQALETKLDDLRSKMADLMAPLHAKLEHAFTAGGCTFHVRSDALENHPESYLSMLVRSPMKTETSEDGAYKVQDLTAKELKALCHFLNTGKAIGPLAKANAEAQELALRFGSEAMLQAMTPSTPDVPKRDLSSVKLDPATITQYCNFERNLEEHASYWAHKLARELPFSNWADGTRIKLDSSFVKLAVANRSDIFQAQPALSGNSRNDLDQFRSWRGAALALQRWFKASNLPAPSFVLEDNRHGVQFSLEFRAHHNV